MSKATGVYISADDWSRIITRLDYNYFDEDNDEFMEGLGEDERIQHKLFNITCDNIRNKFNKKQKDNKLIKSEKDILSSYSTEINNLKDQITRQNQKLVDIFDDAKKTIDQQHETEIKLKQQIDQQHKELQDIKNKLQENNNIYDIKNKLKDILN